MALKDVVRDIEPLLRFQGRLIRLHRSARVAFIGDIHGDLDAVDRVFSLLGSPDTVLVFLGDIVDRGPASSECLERILRAKAERPDHVFLLMGNHEAWGEATFRPADFWGSLSDAETALIAPTLLQQRQELLRHPQRTERIDLHHLLQMPVPQIHLSQRKFRLR